MGRQAQVHTVASAVSGRLMRDEHVDAPQEAQRPLFGRGHAPAVPARLARGHIRHPAGPLQAGSLTSTQRVFDRRVGRVLKTAPGHRPARRLRAKPRPRLAGNTEYPVEIRTPAVRDLAGPSVPAAPPSRPRPQVTRPS